MIDLFENKHVGDVPAPFYLTQEEADTVARHLRERNILLEFVSEIERWNNFPPDKQSPQRPHGAKSLRIWKMQIEHVRMVARRILSRVKQNDK